LGELFFGRKKCSYGCLLATMQTMQMNASTQKIVTEKAKVLNRKNEIMDQRGYILPGINPEHRSLEPMDDGGHCPGNSNSQENIHLELSQKWKCANFG
jgi:hypothetical protein